MYTPTTDTLLLIEIEDLLCWMGATPGTRSFAQTVWAVALFMEDPEQMRFNTKILYPDVAKKFHTNSAAVERNVRVVLNQIWRNTPEKVSEIVGRDLPRRPKPREFLTILHNYLARRHPKFGSLS